MMAYGFRLCQSGTPSFIAYPLLVPTIAAGANGRADGKAAGFYMPCMISVFVMSADFSAPSFDPRISDCNLPIN